MIDWSSDVCSSDLKFGTGSLPDAEWIERLGKEGGWSVLSGDRRIAKQKPSRELFLRAGLIGFFPLPAVMQLKLHGMTARILLAWPAITIMSETIAQGRSDEHTSELPSLMRNSYAVF